MLGDSDKRAIGDIASSMEAVFEAIDTGNAIDVGTHFDATIAEMTSLLNAGRVAPHIRPSYGLCISLMKLVRAYGRTKRPSPVLRRNIQRTILRLRTEAGLNKFTRIK